MKIALDKYYTSIELSKYCIEKTYDAININDITEIIEPSAGNGSFSNQIENCIAYDIEPENDNIIKQDFLTLDLEYKKGRLFIGNPPFGEKNNLALKFFKKCILLGDYIAFILPISQLNNSSSLYEFDLIYSENLNILKYSEKLVHCCFNIYKRPIKNILNIKNNLKIPGILIKEYRRGCLKVNCGQNYDVRICAWGSSIGKIVDYQGQYAKEFCIFIDDNLYNKENIVQLILNCDWKKEFFMTSVPNLLQWQVYHYLRRELSLL